MKSRRIWAWAAVATASGIVCALAVFAYVQAVQLDAESARAEALERYGGDQVDVCVATCDIPAGTVIDADDVEIRAWVADLLPSEAVTSKDDACGKVAGSTILAGEVVSQRRFQESAVGVAVPEGCRAIAVDVSLANAVGGALGAGMTADVYASSSKGASLIAQNVLVLATEAGSASTQRVTLAAPSSLVEQLIASAEGSGVYFALPAQQESEE